MFGRNTGKPLKGPTMGAHTIHLRLHTDKIKPTGRHYNESHSF